MWGMLNGMRNLQDFMERKKFTRAGRGGALDLHGESTKQLKIAVDEPTLFSNPLHARLLAP
jgi:hypothetical protein